jgi:class 3 adenylate cyclase
MRELRRDLPLGTVTFLFTDIEGSTQLVAKIGPKAFRDVLERHNRLIRDAVAAHAGVDAGTAGDSFLIVFRNAASAVAAAIEAQRALAAATWPAGAEVRVRMGLHTGRGIAGGDGYVGLDIHRAARIAAAAHGGQVLMSEASRAATARGLPPGVGVRNLGQHDLSLRLNLVRQPS